MSADNWTHCPVCREKALSKRKAEFDRLSDHADSLYGKAPQAEYMEAREAARAAQLACVPPKEPTLREDYSIGIDGKEFIVFYTAECTECGYSHRYAYAEELKP